MLTHLAVHLTVCTLLTSQSASIQTDELNLVAMCYEHYLLVTSLSINFKIYYFSCE